MERSRAGIPAVVKTAPGKRHGPTRRVPFFGWFLVAGLNLAGVGLAVANDAGTFAILLPAVLVLFAGGLAFAAWAGRY